MSRYAGLAFVILLVLVGSTPACAQGWSIGANVGLSALGESPGFHFSPTAEIRFDRNTGVGTELGINSQYGAPLLWYTYFKYSFEIRSTGVKPYAHLGPVMMAGVPGAPSFGILVAVGANIPVAKGVYLGPEIVLGPVFNVGGRIYNLFLYGNYYGVGAYSYAPYRIPGSTILFSTVRAGIHYEF